MSTQPSILPLTEQSEAAIPLARWSQMMSFFSSIATVTGQQRVVTLEDLRVIVNGRTTRDSKDGPLFSFGRYPVDRVQRVSANILDVSGLVLDIDNSVGKGAEASCSPSPTLPSTFFKKLERFAYGWYSTHNNSTEWAKWRLLIPLSAPVTRDRFKVAHEGLLALVGRDVNIDRTCGEIGRVYYLPSCPASGLGSAFAGFHEGALLTIEDLIEALQHEKDLPDQNVILLSSSLNSTHSVGRNDTLKSIASAMIFRGETNDRIIAELLTRDASFLPPLFTDISEGYRADAYTGATRFVANVRTSINNNRSALGEALIAPRATQSQNLKVIDSRDFMSIQQIPTQYAISPLVPLGQVTLLGAHGGSGKSMVALILAAHFAAGTAWAGCCVAGGRAAFVSLEDSAAVVLYRLRQIVDEYQLDPRLLEANLRIIDGTEGDGTLATEISQSGTHRLTATSSMEEMRQHVASARFIVVDNASDGFDANENDRRMVRSFVRMLVQIARDNLAGLLLLAHIDKAGARNGVFKNSYSGSTAWHNSARSRLALIDVEGNIELRQEKLNFGKPVEPIFLRWAEDGVLVPAESFRSGGTTAVDEFAVLLAIRAASLANVSVPTARTGPSTAQNVLSTLPELPQHLRGGKGRSRFWAGLEGLRRRGSIRVEEYRSETRHKRVRFVETAGSGACAPTPNTPAN